MRPDRIGARTVSFRPGIPSQHTLKTRRQHPVAIDRRHFVRSVVRLASSLQEELTLKYGVKQIFALAHGLINSVIGHFIRRMTSQCHIGMKLDRS